MMKKKEANKNETGQTTDEDDVEKLVITAEALSKFKPPQKSIEIIGSISAIDGYKLVYSHLKRGQIGRFGFKVHSKDKDVNVQFMAWEGNATRLGENCKLSPGDIVHIDALTAKVANEIFNQGSVPFQLVADSSTEITVMQERKGNGGAEDEKQEAPYVEKFEDIPQHDGLIRIRGFIKSNFLTVTRDLGRGTNFICGSITDGWYKLEVQVATPHSSLLDVGKGQHVEVLGVLKKNANPLYFAVHAVSDIALVDDKTMEFCQMVGAWRYLELPNPVKKMRKE